VKLRCEATLSNTRRPFKGNLSNPGERLVFLNLLSDIAFAAHAPRADTVHHQIGGVLYENQ
jgi:hypothetical protein